MATEKKRGCGFRKLEDAHLTPVVVPDNDPDHQGRVHASTEQHPRSNGGGDLFEEAT